MKDERWKMSKYFLFPITFTQPIFNKFVLDIENKNNRTRERNWIVWLVDISGSRKEKKSIKARKLNSYFKLSFRCTADHKKTLLEIIGCGKVCDMITGLFPQVTIEEVHVRTVTNKKWKHTFNPWRFSECVWRKYFRHLYSI